MLSSIFAPWPSFDEEERSAVVDVLLSNKVNYWTGQECRHFEREFAAWCGSAHAIALSNGTLALDLALHGLRVGRVNGGHETDEVVVTPRTFIASTSCVANAGAVPVFADIDHESGNLSAQTILPVLTDRTRAIIIVHLGGWPVDMAPIMALADARGIKVIEDCAQAHGARYKGRMVGSIGHVAAWSFCQDKIMTTGGEGGMVTTDDPALWRRMWAYKDHGKSWEAVYEREHPPGFRWLHESFGTNWRMLEMQAAIGRVQLRRIADWTRARTLNAQALRECILPYAGPSGVLRLPDVRCEGCVTCAPDDGCVHAYYRLYGFVRPERLAHGWSRDRIVAAIVAGGVPCFQGSCSEVYLERAFEGTGFTPTQRLPVARELGETSLMFLVHPTITNEQIATARQVIEGVLAEASGARAPSKG